MLATIIEMPLAASASVKKDDAPVAKKELKYVKDTDPKVLNARLKEIELLSKTDLSREEKRALRAETKEIEQVLKSRSGGIYLSFGAIIIIAVLLIILL